MNKTETVRQGGILRDCVIRSNIAIRISFWDKAWVAIKEYEEKWHEYLYWLQKLVTERHW